jgi:D-alanine-D-alanine ligase
MIRVGVVRGGVGPHFETSLNAGGMVISHLQAAPLDTIYKPIDIFIDQEGVWHIGGVPANMDKVYHSVDIIYNALHGEYGEDGKLSQTLSAWNIPHTGADPMPSAITYNKSLLKDEFKKLGLKTPQHLLYEAYLEDLDGPSDTYPLRKAKDVFNKMPPPWTLRPLTPGSYVCKTLPELVRAFEVAMNEKVSVLAEELIPGTPASVSVLRDFRGQDLYSTICMTNVSFDEKREVERLAKLVHKSLHLGHYSKPHFIVHKKGIYVIDIETVPKLDNESLQEHLESVGVSLPEFLDHILRRAVGK